MGTKIRSFKPDDINDKKPSPLIFFAKFQEATGLLTFYGLPTHAKLRNRGNSVNSQVNYFLAAAFPQSRLNSRRRTILGLQFLSIPY
jgi:hypothetical protein